MTITVKVSDKTKEQMIEYFEDLKREKTPDYATFQAVDGDTVVTLYNSGKAVFQGSDADLASQFWIETEKINAGHVDFTNSDNKKKEKKETIKDTKYMYINSVGSDEVGTGDYFGPIVVSSSYVKKEDVSFLKELGVMDSKKITDDKILEIAPKIIKRIKYKSLILTNQDYNKFNKDYNMNKIKAIMHNKVLYQMINEEHPEIDAIIVDQFAEKYVYYNYLKDAKLVQRNITFMTKAEDKNMAVAASSIISRYIFIQEFNKLSKSIGFNLPKGASPKVDEIGKEIVKKYGKEKLKSIAKLNFKNTEKILSE